MAQPSLPSIVTCSAQWHQLSSISPTQRGLPGPLLLPPISLSHCPFPASACGPSPPGTAVSPKGASAHPGAQNRVWQVAGTQHTVGCESDGGSLSFPFGTGEVPSLWSSGSLPRPSPTGFVCLRVGRIKKTGNGGDGHRSEQGAKGVTAKAPQQGWVAVSSHTWCPSLRHSAGQEPGVQLLTAICCRCVTVRWLCMF